MIPDFIIFIMMPLLILISIPLYAVEKLVVIPLIFLTISCILAATLINYCFQEKKIDRVEKYVVSTVDNTDVIKLDNQLINLNEKFKRDFEEGEEISIEFDKKDYGFILNTDATFRLVED